MWLKLASCKAVNTYLANTFIAKKSLMPLHGKNYRVNNMSFLTSSFIEGLRQLVDILPQLPQLPSLAPNLVSEAGPVHRVPRSLGPHLVLVLLAPV